MLPTAHESRPRRGRSGRILLPGVALAALGLLPLPAEAQAPRPGINVQPVRITLPAQARLGGDYIVPYTVRNVGPATTRIQLSVVELSRKTGRVLRKNNTARRWVKVFYPRRFNLPAGAVRSFQVRVRVPGIRKRQARRIGMSFLSRPVKGGQVRFGLRVITSIHVPSKKAR